MGTGVTSETSGSTTATDPAPRHPGDVRTTVPPPLDHQPLRFIVCGARGVGKSAVLRCLSGAASPAGGGSAAAEQSSAPAGYVGPPTAPAFLWHLGGDADHPAVLRFAFAGRDYLALELPEEGPVVPSLQLGGINPQLALLVADAVHGLAASARGHAHLLSLAGIRHVVLVVNKMDRVDFDPVVFDGIRRAFESLVDGLGFDTVAVVPVSALLGGNVGPNCAPLPAWEGGGATATLMDYLQATPPGKESELPLICPVRPARSPQGQVRQLEGRVLQGVLARGDEVRAALTGATAAVTRIARHDGSPVERACVGDRVVLTVDDEQALGVAAGDVLSCTQAAPETTDQFEATLTWLHDGIQGIVGRSHDLRLAMQRARASITAIKYRLDTDTLARLSASTLRAGDIAVCTLAADKPLVFGRHSQLPSLGAFTLMDGQTGAPVALGMVSHGLRRSQNLRRQALTITRADREKLNGHAAKIIWFTGLSGSGKSTIANALAVALHERGRRTYVLDGDNIRLGLNKDLGFSDADRVENIRRIAEVSKLMLDAGLVVITAFISPFRQEREMARELVGAENFVEVHVSTPLDVCEQRDVKGLYKKARAGKLPNMTGIHSPYEPPERPDVSVDTSEQTLKETIENLLKILNRNTAL